MSDNIPEIITYPFVYTHVVDIDLPEGFVLKGKYHLGNYYDDFTSCMLTLEGNLEDKPGVEVEYRSISVCGKYNRFYHYVVTNESLGVVLDFKFNLLIYIHNLFKDGEYRCEETITLNNKLYDSWEDAILFYVLDFAYDKLHLDDYRPDKIVHLEDI